MKQIKIKDIRLTISDTRGIKLEIDHPIINVLMVGVIQIFSTRNSITDYRWNK